MKKLDDLNKSYFGPRVSDGAGVYIAGYVFLYIFQAILLIIASFTNLDLKNFENLPTWFSWLTTFVNQAAFVLAIWAYGKVAKKPLLQESRINKTFHWKQAVIIPAIVIASIMAFLPLANGFVYLITLITKKAPSVNIGIGKTWWEIMISMVLASVLPAIGEELLFRGGVARGLKRKNYVFAIIMSGFMFSIFHGNAAQTVHQFLIGMVFAYLYFVTGSLLASGLAHLLNNALAVGLEVAWPSGSFALSVGAEIAVWVVMSIVGFVLLYFLLRLMMKVSKEVKGVEQNTDKMAWAKDLGKAFTLSGIKDNYSRLENSLKTLFDDPCDLINLNGDLQTEKSLAAEKESDVSKEYTTGVALNEEQKLEKLMQEANLQTIKKRKKFDLYSLLAAIGIALAVWIILLIP